jgi:hypothetical protein
VLIKANILSNIKALPGKELVNKFPRRQILGKESVAKLRNNTGRCENVPTPTNIGNNKITAVSMQWPVNSPLKNVTTI